MNSPELDFRAFLSQRRVAELRGRTRMEVLDELCQLVADHPRILDAARFRAAVLEREALVSTGIGLGVAIPHTKIPQVRDYVVAVGRTRQGIDFDALDRQPVRLFFLLGAAEDQSSSFVRLMASVVRSIRVDNYREDLLAAPDATALLAALRQPLTP